MEKHLSYFISESIIDQDIIPVVEKIINNQRINEKDAMVLYQSVDLGILGLMADYMNQKKNGKTVYYNKNIHVEPTNICINQCRFCSYSRKKNEPGCFELTTKEIINKIAQFIDHGITEVHIVGGVHPDHDLFYYAGILKKIKTHFPGIFIKAFTAVELDYMIGKSGLTLKAGLIHLKDNGLDAIPGGGAEIFNPIVRNKICPEKTDTARWLEIHQVAHQLNIPSNATMLYGHIESYEDRIEHLSMIRNLQDLTNGFQVFIPLKYRKSNNKMSQTGEVPIIEDLKNYAISRIFLDNFQHVKAYWPMLGIDTAQITLHFGVNDLDGTVLNSTKIYSMTGMEYLKPKTPGEIEHIIKQSNRIPIERDTLYKSLKKTII